MATATNYLGTSTGLMWDTLLPGVVPVTLYVAVQDGVTEVAEDTVHGLLSVLVPHQTQWSAPAGPATVVPERYCIFTKMQCHPGALWWVDPGWRPSAHQSCSITPPPQLDRGEKI